MSFYKDPKKIVNEITQLHSSFLWQGNEEKMGINWVNWSKMCKSKEEGGLWVRNFESFNTELLCKYTWRILQDDNSILRDLLTSRYSNMHNQVASGTIPIRNKNYSIWWKDLYYTARSVYLCNNWFAGNVAIQVGNEYKSVF